MMNLSDLRSRILQSDAYGLVYAAMRRRELEAARKAYFERLDAALAKGRLVIRLTHGGLGDCLLFSSLPRLLREQRGIDMYISAESRSVPRSSAILEMCFDMNPHFKGYADEPGIALEGYDRDGLLFVPRRNGVEAYERQMGLRGTGLPEISYRPRLIPELGDALYIDRNMIAGQRLGWKIDERFFARLEADARKSGLRVVYADPQAQNLFEYADMIHSCRRFACMFSGSHALAVALRKQAFVVVPENFDGGGIAKFIYPGSEISYLRHRSLRRYLGDRQPVLTPIESA